MLATSPLPQDMGVNGVTKVLKSVVEDRNREAAISIQHFDSDSSLITRGAGLNTEHVTPSFELCQIAFKDLPGDAKAHEVGDILIHQGIAKESCLLSLK